MSRPSNEQLTREAFASWNARDFERLLTYFEEDAVWDVSSIGAPGMGMYRGHTELRRFFREWLDVFPDATIEVEEIETRGEWSMATVVQHVSGGSSGVHVPFRYYGIGHWPAGRLRLTENHTDEARAREAFESYAGPSS